MKPPRDRCLASENGRRHHFVKGVPLSRSSCATDRLRQHFANHPAVHIGQPSLQAVVVEGESRVVEAQQPQDRGVQVVDCQHVFDRFMAELIGRAVREGAFDPAPASHAVKPCGL